MAGFCCLEQCLDIVGQIPCVLPLLYMSGTGHWVSAVLVQRPGAAFHQLDGLQMPVFHVHAAWRMLAAHPCRSLTVCFALQVGLEPDVLCKPEVTQVSIWSEGQQEGAGFEDDPCIQQALRMLQGS